MRRSFTVLVLAIALAGCSNEGGGGSTGNKPATSAPASSKALGSKLGSSAPTSSAAASAAPAASAASSAAPAAAAPDAKVVARGKYLVDNVALCAGCHTPLGPNGQPDMSKYLAGGFEFPEVFGTWRSLNITPDKKTGIGDWTDQQIIDAMRLGKRANGDQLYPIMPYMGLNKLSDDDAKAIVAYLRTVKPVENAVKGNTDLKMGKPPAPKPAGTPPADKDRGAYLVTLMQCGDCHTAMLPNGAPDMTKMFAGGNKWDLPPFIGSGTIYSSNITSDNDTGIGKYTPDQVVAAFTQGKKADGSMVGPPMAFLTPLWAGMTDDDKKAVAAYVKAIPAVKNAVPKSTFKPNPPPGAPPASAPAGSAKTESGFGGTPPKTPPASSAAASGKLGGKLNK